MKWLGFDNRMFLTPEEHLVYKRRPPVRYSARGMNGHNGICEVCGESFTDNNPAQVSHRIPFTKGVIGFGLTPDWLDSTQNLRWAHRKGCNKLVELSDAQIKQYLVDVLVADK